MSLPHIAISIGDPNGVGPEIALRAHEALRGICRPLYCVDAEVMQQACDLLSLKLPNDLEMHPLHEQVTIHPGTVDPLAGRYSYTSFMQAVQLTESHVCEAVVTLPIHKEAWMKAALEYKGHTDLLRSHFGKPAIMMLGCSELYVALYTEHIPLKAVPEKIERHALKRFLLDFYRSTGFDDIAVLGLNPHAGDHGVLGDEEREIEAAIDMANAELERSFKCDGTPYFGPVVPDTAFAPAFRQQHRQIVAMYHDQGLAPLKALYFDESVNISLNLPIIRTSVDHGTAFDIAYQGKARLTSYVNAVNAALSLSVNSASNL